MPSGSSAVLFSGRREDQKMCSLIAEEYETADKESKNKY